VIDAVVAAFALTLARVGTFIQVLPLLGGANMPRTVKVGLSLSLAVLFFNEASGALGQAGGLAALGLTSWVGLGLALLREMVLGGVLGFAMGLFLLPAHVAAEFITQEAGLSFANVLTASGDGSANALTVVFEMLASVVFLTLDLHHGFLLLLQQTFQHLPIGQGFHVPNWDLVTAVSTGEEGGILLVAPVALCLFLTTVVLALMTRAAPQLNLYSVGFPLRVLVCLGAALVMMPTLLTGMIRMFAFFLELLQLRG
jgi:flagellar biosynthetic protein FliR